MSRMHVLPQAQLQWCVHTVTSPSPAPCRLVSPA